MEGVGDAQGGFFKRLSGKPECAGVEFDNRGIGGNTLSDMLDRVAEVRKLKPYDAIVQLGCNDLPRTRDKNPQRRSSPEDCAARVGQLLGEVKGGGRALFVSSFEVSEALAALEAAKEHGYEVWDLYHETRGRTEPWLAADGLHFNDTGHAMIAERLAKWVQGQAA